MNEDPDKFSISKAEARDLFHLVGGLKGLMSGDWFLPLVGKSLKAFAINGNGDYFRAKYPKMSDDAIAGKLVGLAAKNAGLVGMASGATMSASEISTFFTGGAAAPIAVPAGVLSISGDVVAATWIQLRLIYSLATIYGTALDLDDPEDVLLVLHFFGGSKLADLTSTAVAKGGGIAAGKAVKSVASKATLKTIQALGQKVGLSILQKSLVNAAIPIASIGIGGTFNYYATKAIGNSAKKSMIDRAAEHQKFSGDN